MLPRRAYRCTERPKRDLLNAGDSDVVVSEPVRSPAAKSVSRGIRRPIVRRQAPPHPGAWHVAAAAAEPHRGYQLTKRIVDLFGGLIALAIATPLILVAAVGSAFSTRHFPFYVQRRVGYLGQEFRMFKIRSMRRGADREIPLDLNETGGPTFKARNDPRISTFGRFIRRTSIDELPQLLNVVIGQLTLVGPRPALPDEVVQYTHAEARRLSVKPGLTCIWQVSGRSDIPFRHWMAMDRLYIRKRSLWFDLRILARTPWTVVTMRGAR